MFSRLRVLLFGLLVVCVVLPLWAFYFEPASIFVRRYEVETSLGPAFGGMKIALLSDLHVGAPHITLQKLRMTNDTHPDLIVLTGDFLITRIRSGTFIPPSRIAPLLGELKAPLGVWAVLGNHDWWYDAKETLTALEANRIRTLEDHATRLSFRNHAFWLAGISDAWEGQYDITGSLSEVTDSAPVIAMTHNPEIFPDMPARVGLTLAGHTHGGQVYIPFVGRPALDRGRFEQRYALGHIVEDGRHLFVSTGIGTSIYPVRFLVPPEVAFITLKGGD